MSEVAPLRIDVHSHYWPAAYLDTLVECGRTDLRRVLRNSDDLSDRLAEMDSVDVDVSVFSALGPNLQVRDDAAGATRAARVINDIYVDQRQRYGGRVDGFATLPIPHVDASITEAARALDDLALAGIALPCIIDKRPLDDPSFEPLWAYLGSRGKDVVIYVHPSGDDSADHPGLRDFGLNMLLGSTMQIAMAPLRVALSGLTTRYPNLQFIFALCGGTLPYLWQRYERNLRRGLELKAAGSPAAGMFAWMDALDFEPTDPMSLFRRGVWFDTSVQDIPYALRLTKEAVGAQRILLGSDALFASLPEAVETIQSSPDLTDAEKHLILDVNAAGLLSLSTPAATSRGAAMQP